MKRFRHATGAGAGTRELVALAQLVVETSVHLTRFVRRAVRSSPPPTLSISGVRALSCVAANPDISVSDVAQHLLVGVPTASKLVDELVARKFLTRAPDKRDRRRLVLRATARGRRVLATAARPAQRQTAALLAELEPAKRARVKEGLTILRDLLTRADAESPHA